jgi:hypothetical protein
MKRAYFSEAIGDFLNTPTESILGRLTNASEFPIERTQRDAWLEQINILKGALQGLGFPGSLYFEYSIPRMGRRIDVVLLIEGVIFVLEFKVGEDEFPGHAIDQVWDYALDLGNFHEPSHRQIIAPILISTRAQAPPAALISAQHGDKILSPMRANADTLPHLLKAVLDFADGAKIDRESWEAGRYCPTPTIIEAAMALYARHSVMDISRNDAGAINLGKTSDTISRIIAQAQRESKKSICFVTGVPGAGKTLVGLNIATQHIDKDSELYSVFLSGNGPLVKILCEALARDKVRAAKERGEPLRKEVARSEVKSFIQNVHHFRDDCLANKANPPIEHVALFDEAQRAWDMQQTSNFMRRKKRTPDFNLSEPDFLISCLDRHRDWAVIVCLVGGGQEINIGESGIGEWIDSLNRNYPNWHIHISPRLNDIEYGAGEVLLSVSSREKVEYIDELHLGVSMRSFRAEHASLLVKQLLDLEVDGARETFSKIRDKYPIALTRDLKEAKKWLRDHARGSERYGIVVSSQAERLKPHAIDVKSPMDPVHWFLDGKEDVRSSYYLEDVATEFHVQGLELDWACVTWDADFRHSPSGWEHRSFRGDRWTQIKNDNRKKYLKNAYRVLLTRARQGMVIVVPEGDPDDPTRLPEFYADTFEYLNRIGLPII